MRKDLNYYLVDFENVHGNGLSIEHELTSKDHVVIFYTDHSKTVNLESLEALGGSAEVSFKKVPSGRQSVDMHIVSYMGYQIGIYRDRIKIVIVSEDSDFDKPIRFWKEKGYDVSKQSALSQTSEDTKENENERTF